MITQTEVEINGTRFRVELVGAFPLFELRHDLLLCDIVGQCLLLRREQRAWRGSRLLRLIHNPRNRRPLWAAWKEKQCRL